MSLIRDAVDDVDRSLAVADVRTLDDLLGQASLQMAFTVALLAIAAAVAVMLGVIGIYGVMAYIVGQRTAEIGVRLALGAEPGSVARAIVRQGGLVALAGIAFGLAAAWAGSRFLEPCSTTSARATPASSRRRAWCCCWSRSPPAGCRRGVPRG